MATNRTSLRTTSDAIANDLGEEIAVDQGTSTTSHMRDWVQAFTLPFELISLAVCLLLLLPLALSHANPDASTIANLTVIAVFGIATVSAIWVQFYGFVFDATADKLTIPTYLIQRSIPLSDIRDANSEFVPGGTIFGAILAAAANATNKGPRSKARRLYVVNLSGPFGSRQARFLSKRRRDQFLSLLRRFAPQARITRFAAWS